jgi:hypothetical protein
MQNVTLIYCKNEKNNLLYSICLIRLKPEKVAGLPKIPAQPISYEDAKKFLERMGGPASPESWRGKIQGVEYRLGGEMLVKVSQLIMTIAYG